jgi:ferredoxin--NADP+ reductase
MLCGNPDMVKDCTEILKARGFTKNRRRTPGHITAENYW